MTKWEKRTFVLGAAIVFAILWPFNDRATMKRAWAKVMQKAEGEKHVQS